MRPAESCGRGLDAIIFAIAYRREQQHEREARRKAPLQETDHKVVAARLLRPDEAGDKKDGKTDLLQQHALLPSESCHLSLSQGRTCAGIRYGEAGTMRPASPQCER